MWRCRNGSEFINHHLYAYCQRKEITFTRSRPYKKNDNAHVEQKNWSVERRLIGYQRYNSKEALVQFKRVYQLVRSYVNYFQPVMQLQRKTRHGARVHKVYDTARNPYRRLLESGVLTPETREGHGDALPEAQSCASLGPNRPGHRETLGDGNYYIQL